MKKLLSLLVTANLLISSMLTVSPIKTYASNEVEKSSISDEIRSKESTVENNDINEKDYSKKKKEKKIDKISKEKTKKYIERKSENNIISIKNNKDIKKSEENKNTKQGNDKCTDIISDDNNKREENRVQIYAVPVARLSDFNLSDSMKDEIKELSNEKEYSLLPYSESNKGKHLNEILVLININGYYKKGDKIEINSTLNNIYKEASYSSNKLLINGEEVAKINTGKYEEDNIINIEFLHDCVIKDYNHLFKLKVIPKDGKQDSNIEIVYEDYKYNFKIDKYNTGSDRKYVYSHLNIYKYGQKNIASVDIQVDNKIKNKNNYSDIRKIVISDFLNREDKCYIAGVSVDNKYLKPNEIKNYMTIKKENGVLTIIPKESLNDKYYTVIFNKVLLENNKVSREFFNKSVKAEIEFTGQDNKIIDKFELEQEILEFLNSDYENKDKIEQEKTLEDKDKIDQEKTSEDKAKIEQEKTSENKDKIEHQKSKVTKEKTKKYSKETNNEKTRVNNNQNENKEELFNIVKPHQAFLLLNTKDHFEYMFGYPDKTFRPEREMTRAEVAAMFARLIQSGEKDITGKNKFSDVKKGSWYENYIGFMNENGLIKGYPDGSFKPDQPMTRAEFTALASRFDNLNNSSLNKFKDVDKNFWAYNYINSATEKGWINGYPDNTFKPEKGISRSEVIKIMNKVIQREPDKDYIENNQDNIKNFKDLNKNHWAYYFIMEAVNGHDYEKNNSEIWIDLWKHEK